VGSSVDLTYNNDDDNINNILYNLIYAGDFNKDQYINIDQVTDLAEIR
jgi:hypothetical protein